MARQQQPFTLIVPEEAIADLRERTTRTRYPDQSSGNPWAYGTIWAIYDNSSTICVRHSIGGPRRRASMRFHNTRCRCVGSTWTFCTCPVTGRHRTRCRCARVAGFCLPVPRADPAPDDPARFGGYPADAFTVVAPSRPGYGLSFKPGQPRSGSRRSPTARSS